MPNIRILAKAVLQIFCSQGCSNTKCLCPKKGSNSTENVWNRFLIQSVHSHFNLYLYAKYQDPSHFVKRFFRYFVHNVVPIQNAYVRKRGIAQPKIYGIGSKSYHFIFTLVCTYMLNIRILAKAVLQIFCSQICSHTKCLCSKKGNNSTENLRNRFKS